MVQMKEHRSASVSICFGISVADGDQAADAPLRPADIWSSGHIPLMGQCNDRVCDMRMSMCTTLGWPPAGSNAATNE